MGTVGLAQVSRSGFHWDIAMTISAPRSIVGSRTREASYPAQSHTCTSQFRGNKIPGVIGPHGLWNMSMGRIDTCLDVFASLLVMIYGNPEAGFCGSTESQNRTLNVHQRAREHLPSPCCSW